MALDITTTEKSSRVFSVKLKGSIDTETHLEFENELDRIIDDTTKAVILDMSGVVYISSIGIRGIISAKKRLESTNATFAMTDMRPEIKKIFDALKLLPLFEIFDNMPEADKYIDKIIKEEIEKGKK